MACACCGSYVLTCCCPGTTIPTTLHAALSSQSNCGCVSGTVTLTWNGVNQWWQGTGAFGTCGRNVTLTLYCCDALGNCSSGNFGCGQCDPSGHTNVGWFLTDSFSDACVNQRNCWSAQIQCSPFQLVFFPSGSESCGCTTPSSSYRVVVTP